MDDPKATATARAMAAERILDRGLGKPLQVSSISMAAKRAEELTEDELAMIIAGTQPAPPLAAEHEAEPLPATRGQDD